MTTSAVTSNLSSNQPKPETRIVHESFEHIIDDLVHVINEPPKSKNDATIQWETPVPKQVSKRLTASFFSSRHPAVASLTMTRPGRADVSLAFTVTGGWRMSVGSRPDEWAETLLKRYALPERLATCVIVDSGRVQSLIRDIAREFIA